MIQVHKDGSAIRSIPYRTVREAMYAYGSSLEWTIYALLFFPMGVALRRGDPSQRLVRFLRQEHQWMIDRHPVSCSPTEYSRNVPYKVTTTQRRPPSLALYFHRSMTFVLERGSASDFTCTGQCEMCIRRWNQNECVLIVEPHDGQAYRYSIPSLWRDEDQVFELSGRTLIRWHGDGGLQTCFTLFQDEQLFIEETLHLPREMAQLVIDFLVPYFS